MIKSITQTVNETVTDQLAAYNHLITNPQYMVYWLKTNSAVYVNQDFLAKPSYESWELVQLEQLFTFFFWDECNAQIRRTLRREFNRLTE